MIKVYDLKCFGLRYAKGVEKREVEFSWKVKFENNFSYLQKAFRINVFCKNKDLIFDSEKIICEKSTQVPIIIDKLVSSEIYTFKIKVWDINNNESEWSDEGRFITGLFDESEWMSNFINANGINEIDVDIDAVWYRKEFNIPKIPNSAIIHIASIGHHELYVNGKKVGDRVLAPSRSKMQDYKRTLYVTYDISDYLKIGNNAIGIWCDSDFARYSQTIPAFMCHLAIHNIDEKTIITSDKSWLCKCSNIKHINGFQWANFGGE